MSTKLNNFSYSWNLFRMEAWSSHMKNTDYFSYGTRPTQKKGTWWYSIITHQSLKLISYHPNNKLFVISLRYNIYVIIFFKGVFKTVQSIYLTFLAHYFKQNPYRQYQYSHCLTKFRKKIHKNYKQYSVRSIVCFKILWSTLRFLSNLWTYCVLSVVPSN